MRGLMLAVVAIVAVILLSGCTSSDTVYSGDSGNAQGSAPNASEPESQAETGAATAPEPNLVQNIDIFLAMAKNWDADADPDGIEVTLEVKDRDGGGTTANGRLSAKLYSTTTDYETMDKIKLDLLKEWDGIAIEKENYDWIGVKVRLEYGDMELPEDRYATGWLEITFVTEDGKEFNAQDDSVFLRGL